MLRGIALLSAGLALLGGCSGTLPVRTDVNAAAGPATCRTYTWLRQAEDRSGSDAFSNPLNDQRLRAAIARRLASRGIEPAPAGGTADCLVDHAIGSRTGADEDADTRVSVGAGTGWGRRWPYGGMVWDTAPSTWREGRIAIDVYRTAGREPLWHAEADVDVTRLTGAEAESRIESAVGAMFARLPVTR